MEDYKKKYEEALEKAKSMMALPDDKAMIEEIFPELKESEDEQVRKDIVFYIAAHHKDDGEKARWLYWLEKQGEHANFRNKIQIGDKVTRNRDGVLVNLSQLKRVAKPAENRGMNLVEEEMTPFQKKVFCIVDTAIEEEQGLSNICNELLSLAIQEIKQTLEVKEVGLEHEVESYWKQCDMTWCRDAYSMTHIRSMLSDIAKHFFELGLKAQKGEEV